MSDIKSPDDLNERGEVLRAQSVWLLGYVAFFSWLFFVALYWILDVEPAGMICRAECIAYVCVTFFLRKSKNYLLVMNALIACSVVGFFAVACSSPIHRGVIHYTPIAILVASQIFGKRPAFVWMLVSLAVMTLFYLCVHDTGLDASDSVQLSILLGVPCSLFFCCYQAEIHYEKKTSKLVGFSKELQERANELEVLATTDALTGLSNRYQFQNELLLRVQDPGDRPFCLFLIDMNGFKEINDTLGHGVGDKVLAAIGSRLAQHCDENNSLARLGGDEFCVIHDDIDSASDAVEQAQRLLDVLIASYSVEENDFALGASIGFALCPENSDSPNSLLAFADTAMYHAKQNNLGISGYRKEMTERIVENRDLNDQLATAIEKNEFRLVYQPQFDIQSGRVTGAEALLRWLKDGKTISPAKFIPLLEQSGRMIEVSQWVLEEACRQQAYWRDRGFDIRVAVNVSAVQFDEPNFVANVLETIERLNVVPNQIDLEITEGLLIHNVPAVVAKLSQLRESGIKISIDDFGTGYSSLSYLRMFPIDKLKIDRSFVKDIPDNDNGVLASTIILLGQMLGMCVLAEGVETVEQLKYLKEHDCGEVQGFFYSRPEKPDVIFQRYVNQHEFASEPSLTDQPATIESHQKVRPR